MYRIFRNSNQKLELGFYLCHDGLVRNVISIKRQPADGLIAVSYGVFDLKGKWLNSCATTLKVFQSMVVQRVKPKRRRR
jgi:hypothetical protein